MPHIRRRCCRRAFIANPILPQEFIAPNDIHKKQTLGHLLWEAGCGWRLLTVAFGSTRQHIPGEACGTSPKGTGATCRSGGAAAPSPSSGPEQARFRPPSSKPRWASTTATSPGPYRLPTGASRLFGYPLANHPFWTCASGSAPIPTTIGPGALKKLLAGERRLRWRSAISAGTGRSRWASERSAWPATAGAAPAFHRHREDISQRKMAETGRSTRPTRTGGQVATARRAQGGEHRPKVMFNTGRWRKRS